MKNYEEFYFQIVRFEERDVITGSDNDNVGGANENWNGWGDAE